MSCCNTGSVAVAPDVYDPSTNKQSQAQNEKTPAGKAYIATMMRQYEEERARAYQKAVIQKKMKQQEADDNLILATARAQLNKTDNKKQDEA